MSNAGLCFYLYIFLNLYFYFVIFTLYFKFLQCISVIFIDEVVRFAEFAGCLCCYLCIIEDQLDVGVEAVSSCDVFNFCEQEWCCFFSFYSQPVAFLDCLVYRRIDNIRIHCIFFRNRISYQNSAFHSKLHVCLEKCCKFFR